MSELYNLILEHPWVSFGIVISAVTVLSVFHPIIINIDKSVVNNNKPDA